MDVDLSRLEKSPILGVTLDAMRHFRLLLAHKKCRKMRRPDLLIDCVALANKAVLVTRNVKDLANVPGLTLENWFE